MSEIKRNFLQGKMNIDLDERLVPNGQTVYSLNNLVAKSEGSDVGAIENSLGNEQKTFLGLTDALTVGSFKDDANQQIYYFVTSLEKDIIIEYSDTTESIATLLESTRVNGKTLLNFSKEKLITGVIKIINGTGEGNLLGWTDDNEQPRIINIERAKTYSVDGFTEDDISLIKKPPIFAPEINLTFADGDGNNDLNDRFVSFCYSYRYLDGQVSALSPFSSPAFSAKTFSLDAHTLENNGMQNAFSAVDILFNTGEKQVTDVILAFKESNSNTVYIIDIFNKENNQWQDNETRNFKFSDIKIYGLMDEKELYRLFDAIPRRAKAMDVVGNRIAIANYVEGYDLIDKFGEALKIDFNLSLFSRDLSGDIVDNELVFITIADDGISFDLTGIELNKGTRLSFTLNLIETTNGTGVYNGTSDFILNRTYIDVRDLATDADFEAFLKIYTTDFLNNYTITPPDNSSFYANTEFIVSSSTITGFVIQAPTITYQIDNTPADTEDANFKLEKFNWKYLPQSAMNFKSVATDSSCKTNRSYEVAQIYLDEYGRSTTALTSPDNTLFIPQENAINQNKIRVNVNHRAPEWAKYFRFAIKQNKKEYQNIFLSTFYEDGIYRWVKLDGANRDKVNEGDTLILKSDLSGFVEDPIKVRVLEVRTQPANFITGNVLEDNEEIIEDEGLYMKIKSARFNMNYDDSTFLTFVGYDYDKKNHPTIELGAFGTTGTDGIYTDYKMSAGSSVDIYMKSWEKGDGQTHIYEKSFVVQENHDNFQLWFESEVKSFDNKLKEYSFKRNADGELLLRMVSKEDGAYFETSRITAEINIRFSGGVIVFETEPEDDLTEIFHELGQTFNIVDGYHNGNIQDQNLNDAAIIDLDFFNCFAQGDGIESYRYKDAVNKKYLSTDTRPTTDTSKEFKEIHRYADITYSEPFIESLGINGLSTFNLALANYKDDIIKKYGSIQKIVARDSNLLVMQEDKISQVLYGKELIISPDGSKNLSGIDEVLGTQVMYAGEHGISRNPESVAMSGNRIYFTDEKRNHVCRLSIDGITIISESGMTSYFRNLFTGSMNKAKLGAFDPYTGKYTLTALDQIIYNPLNFIDCKNSIKKSNFSGTVLVEIDFGLSVGDAGVSIVANNGKPVTVDLSYNGTTYSKTTSTADVITFTKTDLLPRKASLTITAPEQGTNFEVAGNCVVLNQFTVVSIVKGSSKDAGKTIDNRYKWIKGNYSSPYKHFNTVFKEEGLSIYNRETGDEGTAAIPITDAVVYMESYKGFNHTAGFGDNDKMKYLISNTNYPEEQTQDLIDASTELTPIATDTSGGERITTAQFNMSRPLLEQFLYMIWDYSGLSINIDTNIYIYFDSSGSMNSTLAPLQEMRDTILKDALLPLYEYDESAYNAKVQVISNSTERTLDMLNFLNENPIGNVISLVFQDEAQTAYTSGGAWTINDTRTAQYDTDISTLRSRLLAFDPSYFRGVVFQVETSTANEFGAFQRLMPAVQNGTGNYAGVNGLADRDEVAFKYNVTPASTPAYYKDLIVNTLRELGYQL